MVTHEVQLAGFALFAAMLCTTSAFAKMAPQSHEGMVVSAAAGKLVMTGTDGKEHSHSVPAAAMVVVDGKPGKLEDLRAGQRIRVMTDEDGRVLEVATIDLKKATEPFAGDSALGRDR